MSGSEDGQLRSPGAENFISGEDEEHDTGSLEIKPPQANTSHSRDSTGTGSRRKEKISKEKKHSKEKRHRERIGKDRDRDNRVVERERKIDQERRVDHHRSQRDERADLERQYHHQRSGYPGERTDVGRELISSNERRYQKHYDRTANDIGGRGGGSFHNFHQQQHHHQQPNQHYHHQTQIHMQQRPRSDYFDRGQNYHHGGGSVTSVSMEYHTTRHHQVHGRHADYAQQDVEIEITRERRRYSYDEQKDTESLEQDLRSRLLSKRHKYARVSDPCEGYEVPGERRNYDRDEHNYEKHERAAAKAERHKIRTEREAAKVIEVLDSPELYSSEARTKHKHKHASRMNEVIVRKLKSPDDPELLARKAKLLAAEQEKAKRKESAREELEARREMRRERNDINDALSPTAVAASVTAGLHIAKRKHADGELSKRKRIKNISDNESDLDEEEIEDSESEEESESDSAAESEDSYTKSKTKKKNSRTSGNDEDMLLPESPLSIGELSKSPKRKKHKTKRTEVSNDQEDNDDDDDDDNDDDENDDEDDEDENDEYEARSSRSRSVHSHSITGSASHDSRSSHSRSRSSHRSSHSSQSRSRSQHSRSRSISRSRSRSEERGMKSDQTKTDTDAETSLKKKNQHDSEDLPVCDAKGNPLPNYFPGVQGCRSVEEFQCLNRIEEGTYGVVYRARDKRTSEIVALKRLKMEKEKEGFPITSLREINTLLKGQHPNIVTVREIVVGSNMDKIFIVMDYVEHDLKSLMETMKNRKQSFFPGEVKCLTQQLLRAVGHLHDNWILHRDLKTSNLLLSHKGILKVGDFGLAREYGSPLKKYTSLVVTLWYRAPELLLCSPEYSTPIDVWSVGCIFAEFLQMMPLFPGKSEIDQLNRIFKELGTPNEKIWPGYKELPAVKNLLSQNSHFTEYPVSNLRKRFSEKTNETGIEFLQGLLTYDPKKRLSADAALKHAYFKELPLPIDPSMFPTWPAKSELGARKALASSPKPPSGGSQFKQLGRDDIVVAGGSSGKVISGIITGNKKTATNTGFVLNAGIDQRQLAMGPGFSLKF